MHRIIGGLVAAGVLGAVPAAQAVVPGDGATVPRGTLISSPACEVRQSDLPNMPPQDGDRVETWGSSAILRHARVGATDFNDVGFITPDDCAPVAVNDPGRYELEVQSFHRVEENRLAMWWLVGEDTDSRVIRFRVPAAKVCKTFTSVRGQSGRQLSDQELEAIGLSGRQLLDGGRVSVPKGKFGKGIEMRTEDGAVIRLGGGSTFRLQPGCKGDAKLPSYMRIRLMMGSIWAKVPKTEKQKVQVETDRAVAGPRGTTYEVTYAPKRKRTTVRVFAGKVYMAPRVRPKTGIVLTKGQTGVSVGNGPVRRLR